MPVDTIKNTRPVSETQRRTALPAAPKEQAPKMAKDGFVRSTVKRVFTPSSWFSGTFVERLWKAFTANSNHNERLMQSWRAEQDEEAEEKAKKKAAALEAHRARCTQRQHACEQVFRQSLKQQAATP